ncbi:hypothetical protein [Demequina capsici]|uniref:CBM-cenC domain-containing protein n=1 Tax=Demequina capsici TaxID=3075620 RepID=A0AA96JAZ7_9MICO|nr:hypothetical protein [Demequina sp. OYTSA14]WNM25246.1 hypothetical protein RN606_03605 [Demequina sp. OYTSA14]
MPSAHAIAATVGATALPLKSGRVVMDASWSPYIQAEIAIPKQASAVLDTLDPRAAARVSLTVSRTNPAQSRTFNLGVRERIVDHENSDVIVKLASDEARLQDASRVSSMVDDGASSRQRTDGNSMLDLRNLVNGYVFDHLVPGNLTRNPSVSVAWVCSASAVVAAGSSFAGQTIYFDRGVASAAVSLDIGASDEDEVTPGAAYTYSVDLMASLAGVSVSLVVYDGTTIINSATRTVLASTWSRQSIGFTAPTSGRVHLRVYWSSTPSATTRLHVGRLALASGTTALTWARPSLVADSSITYDFTANPGALTLPPGLNLWSYLEPLLQLAGARLYCDEAMAWHLVAADAVQSGQLILNKGDNVTDATDTITRESNGAWWEAVVIRYDDGTTVKYDAAGKPGGLTLRLDYDRPFPGAGAAARLLARSQGRGRVFDLKAISNYAATPGMALSASLPDTDTQTGAVLAVEWAWPADEMRVTSRGLIDTVAGSWALQSTGLTWSAVGTSVTWNTYS